MNKINIFCIGMLIFLASCNRYHFLSEGNLYSMPLYNEFLAISFDSCSKYEIPTGIIKFLEKQDREKYTFALSNDNYNRTDIPVYPNKRFLFAGYNPIHDFGFFYFEKGGIALSYNLVIYKKQKNITRVASISFFQKSNSINDLKLLLDLNLH